MVVKLKWQPHMNFGRMIFNYSKKEITMKTLKRDFILDNFGQVKFFTSSIGYRWWTTPIGIADLKLQTVEYKLNGIADINCTSALKPFNLAFMTQIRGPCQSVKIYPIYVLTIPICLQTEYTNCVTVRYTYIRPITKRPITEGPITKVAHKN